MPISPYSQRRVLSKPGDNAYWIVKGPRRDVQKALLEAGVLDHCAKDLSKNAFYDWTPEEVKTFLKKWPGSTQNLTNVQRTQWIERDWIKPPRRLWSQAAEKNLALCVNKAGEWDLRRGGYVAISHVWSEGIYGDDKNRGIPRYVLDQLFENIKTLDISWIWLDPLAVPGGLLQLSTFEENTKVALINQMATIYERAEFVVVFDALVMNLPSTDPIDVAFALCCGKWRARLWTFQEAKLAYKIVVLTKTGVVDYHELINKLGAMAGFDKQHRRMEATSQATPEQQRLAKGPYFALRYLVRWPDVGTSLVDIVRACTVRDVSYEIDNARALYPSLGLKWTEMTREEGIARIHYSRPEESMQLVLTWGAPRCLEGYAWAPAYLNGLRHHWINGNTWDIRGIRNSWQVFQVRKVLPEFKTTSSSLFGNIAFEIVAEKEGSQRVLASKFWVHESERKEAQEEFLQEVQKGQAYILSRSNGNMGDEMVLFVKRSREDPGEVSVYLTALWTWVGETNGDELSQQPERPDKVELLLKHQSPLSIEDISTDIVSLDYSDVVSPNKTAATAEHLNESALQIAIRTGDLSKVTDTLHKTSKGDLNGVDSMGWNALHTAAYLNFTDVVAILPKKKNWINALTGNRESPLIFACQNNNLEMATELLKRGADSMIYHEGSGNGTSQIQPLQAALQPRNKKIDPALIYLLLENRADPNVLTTQNQWPIFFALQDQLALDHMLKHDADPAVLLPDGASPLTVAAARGWAHAIPMLINAGCPIDILSGGNTALQRAVANQHEKAVNECIKAQANINRVYPNGETAVMLASKLGNYDITKLLLDNGAKLHFRDHENGATALQWAVEGGHARVVKLIIQHLDMGKLEKERRMILRSRTSNGETATDLAKRAGNPAIEKLLEDYGDQKSWGYDTVIHSLVLGVFAGSAGIGWKTTFFFLGKYRKAESIGGMVGFGGMVGICGGVAAFATACIAYPIHQYWLLIKKDLL
ncbi:hypothetical protein BGZ60DRAFT_522102 [Tricladium varicosporioides]|nr:hypothetical protein BGZ60DRAFT_522102 [Hymenoscyphus varicosporioides]